MACITSHPESRMAAKCRVLMKVIISISSSHHGACDSGKGGFPVSSAAGKISPAYGDGFAVQKIHMGRMNQIALVNPHKIRGKLLFDLIQSGIKRILASGGHQNDLPSVGIEIENVK